MGVKVRVRARARARARARVSVSARARVKVRGLLRATAGPTTLDATLEGDGVRDAGVLGLGAGVYSGVLGAPTSAHASGLVRLRLGLGVGVGVGV